VLFYPENAMSFCLYADVTINHIYAISNKKQNISMDVGRIFVRGGVLGDFS